MHKQVPRTDKIEVSEMNINNLIRCNNKNCVKGLNIAGDDLYNNFLAKLNCVWAVCCILELSWGFLPSFVYSFVNRKNMCAHLIIKSWKYIYSTLIMIP